MVVGPNDIVHKKAIQLGISDGEDIQVTEGLAGTEQVVTTGAYGLDDGTKVKIGKPDAESGDAK